MKKCTKLIAVALSLCLLLITGCTSSNTNDLSHTNADNSDDKVKITVAVDIFNTDSIKQLKNYAQILYPELQIELIEFDYDSYDMGERESQITAMKSEIMAGKGPDAFIMSTIVPWEQYNNGGHPVVEDRIFRDPNKAIRNRIFLPLDDYIASSQVFSMDDHVSTIIDAGKYDGKQYVLPLTYTYEVYLYNKSDVDLAEIDSWNDVVSHKNHAFVDNLGSYFFDWMANRFGTIADYESYSLLLTKEDLINELTAYDSMREHSDVSVDKVDNFPALSDAFLDEWASLGDEVTAVPILNKNDGITAFVNHYVAVNANSKHPDWAFKFIELFYSPEVQSEEGFKYEDGGNTMHAAVYCRPDGLEYLFNEGIATGKIMYKEYPMLEEMNSKINSVRFYTPIDRAFYDIAMDYITNGDLEIVDAYYKSFQMEISE